jgi:hypothetical protein
MFSEILFRFCLPKLTSSNLDETPHFYFIKVDGMVLHLLNKSVSLSITLVHIPHFYFIKVDGMVLHLLNKSASLSITLVHISACFQVHVSVLVYEEMRDIYDDVLVATSILSHHTWLLPPCSYLTAFNYMHFSWRCFFFS